MILREGLYMHREICTIVLQVRTKQMGRTEVSKTKRVETGNKYLNGDSEKKS